MNKVITVVGLLVLLAGCSGQEWLSVKGDKIVGAQGREVQLRGVNIYVGSFRGEVEPGFIDEDDPRQKKFLDDMLLHMVTEGDFADMRQMGMNMARLGLSTYKDFENDSVPYTYNERNFESLDGLVDAAERQRIYLILNMRQSPGGHNTSPHSGNNGENRLWEDPEYRNRLVKLWEAIASRYKDRAIIAGYDVLNEPDAPDRDSLNELYADVIEGIRLHDPRHILFLEGNRWATDLDWVDAPADDNCALSTHFYNPHWYTHHTAPGTYPDPGIGFTKEALREEIVDRMATSLEMPVWMGEFGAKTSVPTHLAYSRDVRDILDELEAGWSYFNYKNAKGISGTWAIYYVTPDNLFRRFVDGFEQAQMLFGEYLALYTDEELADILESLQTFHFLRKDGLWEMLAE